MYPLKVDLLSVTFDLETAEIRWLIVTHHMKIQHIPSLPGFPHKGHCTQANQILPDVRRLKGLTIHHKNFGSHYVTAIIVATCLVSTYYYAHSLLSCCQMFVCLFVCLFVC